MRGSKANKQGRHLSSWGGKKDSTGLVPLGDTNAVLSCMYATRWALRRPQSDGGERPVFATDSADGNLNELRRNPGSAAEGRAHRDLGQPGREAGGHRRHCGQSAYRSRTVRDVGPLQ